MRVRRPVLAGVAAIVGGVLLLAGCATSGTYDATPVPKTSTTARPSGPATTAPAPATCANQLASYAPADPVPGPTDLPAGSYMDTIRKRGRLIAGVSADTLLLGARNPITGTIEGFDIDMLRAVSQAIFGRPDRIELRVITTAQRIPVLTSGSVDIVARAMTITCTRWTQIAFSAEYYRAGQKVLVPLGSTATGMESLRGRKVCAPNGSTSMDKLRTFTGLVPVGSDTHTGCLVLFQQGTVDAITGDDTVLAGLSAQDPYAHVVQGKAFTAEPYGLGISLKHPEFVSFVNGVIAQLKSDGRWAASYDKWLKAALGPAPAPPAAVYGRTP